MKKKLMVVQRRLRRRLLDLLYSQNLTHVGSCFSVLDILIALYQTKKPEDLVVLSNGHAAFGWYVVLEEWGLLTPKQVATAPIHPDSKLSPAIPASTGSLGQGLPIAIGLALANSRRRVYCVISDGECSEGSVWESIRFLARHPLPNLTIFLNANGWGAYDSIDLIKLRQMIVGTGITVRRCQGQNLVSLKRALATTHSRSKNSPNQLIWCDTTVNHVPGLRGQAAHYQKLSRADYEKAVKLFN